MEERMRALASQMSRVAPISSALTISSNTNDRCTIVNRCRDSFLTMREADCFLELTALSPFTASVDRACVREISRRARRHSSSRPSSATSAQPWGPIFHTAFMRLVAERIGRTYFVGRGSSGRG